MPAWLETGQGLRTPQVWGVSLQEGVDTPRPSPVTALQEEALRQLWWRHGRSLYVRYQLGKPRPRGLWPRPPFPPGRPPVSPPHIPSSLEGTWGWGEGGLSLPCNPDETHSSETGSLLRAWTLLPCCSPGPPTELRAAPPPPPAPYTEADVTGGGKCRAGHPPGGCTGHGPCETRLFPHRRLAPPASLHGHCSPPWPPARCCPSLPSLRGCEAG